MKDNILPVHVAIIMDGNGRWAKKRGLPRVFGHKEGAKSVRAITEACAETGIKYLTLYAFSTENWKRPKKEVGFLMGLLQEHLKKELPVMMKNNVKLMTIGDIYALPKAAVKKLEDVKKATAENSGLALILALNYGSRSELAVAAKKLAVLAKNGIIKPESITEKTLESVLSTNGIPDPDLLIRTSGEMRISNFLLWQAAYAEFYVTRTLWPDFRKKEFFAALKEYAGRERRYGGI